VDLRRAHGRAGVRRVIARDRLQEDALRQAHAAILGELLRRHDLSPRDPCHVGDDGLDLGDAVVTEELADLAHHGLPFTLIRRSRDTRRRRPQTGHATWSCPLPSTLDAIAPRARTLRRPRL